MQLIFVSVFFFSPGSIAFTVVFVISLVILYVFRNLRRKVDRTYNRYHIQPNLQLSSRRQVEDTLKAKLIKVTLYIT